MTRALRTRYVSLAKRQGNSTGNDNREEEEEESTTINKIHHVTRHQHHNTNKLDQSQTISTMYNNDHDNLSVSNACVLCIGEFAFRVVGMWGYSVVSSDDCDLPGFGCNRW